jgi:hypothetical protein
VVHIDNPELQQLSEQWSPVVYDLLHDLGRRVWPALRTRQMIVKFKTIPRYLVEGSAQWGDSLVWAVSHTSNPSTFDQQGRLLKGKRECWLVMLHSGEPPTFTIEGAQISYAIPADRDKLAQALSHAEQSGPKSEMFYGNKGPLSQRKK